MYSNETEWFVYFYCFAGDVKKKYREGTRLNVDFTR